MFVTDEQIQTVADDMQGEFEIGSLHSMSTIKQIVPFAADALADAGFPTRSSLCIVVAKVALMRWLETIHDTKRKLEV
jgi:hypothetical protein